jgi:GNAT superfamily N-acetyltransferase
MVTDDVDIARERPDSDTASELLGRYYTELDSRFPGGFDPERTVAAPARELVGPAGAFFVARLDGHPIGCGGIRKLDETTAEIKRMWIDPVARSRGIGRRLLAALEDAAVELGCHTVRLDTNAHLTEAVALYRSSGYSEIPAYNDNLYAARWFEKRLA